jgi:hypothetical protein
MSNTATGSGDASHDHSVAVLSAKPSPSIERLPDELIIEIFMLCLPDYTNYWQSPRMLQAYQAQDAPLLLCRVCRSWRQLAITTCSLWSTIIYKGSDRDSQLHLLHLWLSRSGSVPIVVHIRLSNARRRVYDVDGNITTQPLLPTTMSRVVELLMPSIGRWRELRMQGYVDNFLPLIDVFPKESLVALAVLEADCGSDKISPLWSAIPRSAPLRFLKLTRCSAIPAALQTDPRLIAHVELRGGSSSTLDSYLQPLQMFPNLRHADLYPGLYHRLAHVQRNLIHVLTIVSFRLVMSRRMLEAFITRIYAPALQNLCIDSGSVSLLGITFPVASFMDFMSNSSPPLRQLIIRNFDITDPDFLRTLDLMESLVELRLEMSSHASSAGSNGGTWLHPLLRALCAREAGPIVLPSLQHITLLIQGAKLTDLHVEMIRSRRDSPLLASRNATHLRKVEIGIPSTSTSTLEQDGGEPLRQLRLMEAEGLSLIIRMTGEPFGDMC